MKTLKMHENRNNNMESFYEENGQYVATTTQSRAQRNLKRPESLDLNLAANNNKQPGGKKARCNQIPAVLASPDLHMLKWGTPDLEKFIMSSDPLQTPTPSLMFAPNPIIKVWLRFVRRSIRFHEKEIFDRINEVVIIDFCNQ